MRIAILETISMPAGHEVEFDRLLVDELKLQEHQPRLFVPQNFPLKIDHGIPIDYLSGGEVVTYAGAGKIKKIWLSLLREQRRISWFDSAFEKIKSGLCEAVIIPTATYRYLRTLLNSNLKNSPVPVYFVFHGINPGEQPKFEKYARKCLPYKNIHLRVITLRNDFEGKGLTNLHLIKPPVFKPLSLKVDKEMTLKYPIKIGFFGQFRKEKNLDSFLNAFVKADFSRPVELIVQGATAKPDDGEAFEQLRKAYSQYANITFWHKNLIGVDWEKALLSVDVIILPYAAERYRYHWSAMLFTAIGFYKPILVSPEINPEVLAEYNIGNSIQVEQEDVFAQQLQSFVDAYEKNLSIYQSELERANKEFGHDALIRNILKN